MPEYTYPGVYVVEVDSGIKPIDGISTSTSELIGRDCIDRLRRLARPLPADWTSHNTHDPGVALLELLSYVAGLLVERGDLIADEAMLHSSRLVAAALTLSKERELPCGSALRAVNFFEGRLLREGDLERDQKDRGHCLHIATMEIAK